MTLESKFSIQDRVLISAIQMHGIIDSISWGITGMQFRVVYWNDNQRYETWMYEWEIAKCQ
jgi:hypothetical protein